MNAIIIDLHAGLRRAACPMSAPRLAGAWVAAACDWWLLPLNIAAAAVAGYAEAQRAVLVGDRYGD